METLPRVSAAAPRFLVPALAIPNIVPGPALRRKSPPRKLKAVTSPAQGQPAMPASPRATLVFAAIATLAAPACEQPHQPPPPPAPPPPPISTLVISSPPQTKRPPFAFSSDDEKFLEEVQRGCFNFLWSAGDPGKPGHATGMAPDRTSKPTVSVAGVGFQLSALCIGVERGWITRDQGRQRAELILHKLTDNTTIKKA